jgi:agmatinase
MRASTVPDFLASELENRTFDNSLFNIIPVPLEQSVSYGSGTLNGPRAILEASQQLEAWDGESMPLELGIHTNPFLDCSGTIESVLQRVQKQTAATLEAGKIPVLLGGEHTVTVGALQAVNDFFDKPVGLFQLDAHGDLRNSYEGSRYSHACVARRAHADLNMVLCQFGVRALCKEEVIYRRQHNIAHLDAKTFHQGGTIGDIFPLDFPDKIYLSLDVDGLDPSVIRATGTPVPGGPGWYDTLAVIEKVIKNRTVIGFDVVELAPQEEDHASSFTAALLVYLVMGLVQRNQS